MSFLENLVYCSRLWLKYIPPTTDKSLYITVFNSFKKSPYQMAFLLFNNFKTRAKKLKNNEIENININNYKTVD